MATKVTVTGAAGQIGYAILFRIASGQLLGPDEKVALRLLEIPDAVKAAEGTALELFDCAFPLLADIEVTDDATVAFDGVNIALLIGARPRSKGMERADLLEANGAIFKPQGEALNEHAADDVRILVWGNHSPTMFPDLFNAKVNGQPAAERVDMDWYENEYIPRVGKRGAEIIEARGASSAASAANAAIDHVRDWMSGADGLRSMVVRSGGQYGVEEGIMSSFPVRCGGGSFEVVEGLEVEDFARGKIDRTVSELKEERDAVRKLGLVE